MKLLNCVDLQIEEFFGSSIPSKYAILSHTWEAGEVSFQDLGNAQATADKPGWFKIRRACQLALEQGYSHAWVDTCCIDKTNFTELTEAINSMFKWYARSTVCYAYLADVGGKTAVQLQDSRWFTRGWTLQELIAPCRVEFYDKDWNFLGTRADLSEEVQERTGIGQSFLAHSVDDVEELLTTIPVACRMSWAAGRVTTREEDLAYCLLGIFGVNMPLLYGEGKESFIRLQEEIIRMTNDTSIFAWGYPESESAKAPGRNHFGILASSPDLFAYATSLQRSRDTVITEYSITNQGLLITANVPEPVKVRGEVLMQLGWYIPTAGGKRNLGVLLRDQGDGILVRSSPYIERATAQTRASSRLLVIRKNMNERQSAALETSHAKISVAVTLRADVRTRVEFLSAFPQELWDPQRHFFRTSGLRSFHGIVHLRLLEPVGRDMVMICSLKHGSLDEPLVWLAVFEQYADLLDAATSHDHDRLQNLCRQHGHRELLLREDVLPQMGLWSRLVGCSKPPSSWRFNVSHRQRTQVDEDRKHSIEIILIGHEIRKKYLR